MRCGSKTELNRPNKELQLKETKGQAISQTGNKGLGVGSGSPLVALGREVWNEVFQGEEFKLPDIEFINLLQKLLPDEKVLQLITDIKYSHNIKKTRFYEADHETAQDAMT